MTMNEEMETVRKFAADMGYKIYEEEYETMEKPPRPAYSIVLGGCENGIEFAWYTDTGERMF